MSTHRMMTRVLGTALATVLVSTAIAPAAQADRHHGHRTDRGPCAHGRHVAYVVRRGPVFVERPSEAGALFGFLGGLVLGTVIADAHPAPPPPPVYVRDDGYGCTRGEEYVVRGDDERDYRFYDPYCRRTFGSLGACQRHLAGEGHPCVVEVMDARSGRRVEVLHWRAGVWIGEDGREASEPFGDERGDAPPYEPWDE